MDRRDETVADAPRAPRLARSVARTSLIAAAFAVLAGVAGWLVARATGVTVYGAALTLMLLSVGMRLWLGRMPASLRSKHSLVRRRRR